MFYSPEYGALVGMCFLNTQTLVQRDGVESRREALGGRGENAGRRARCLGTYGCWLALAAVATAKVLGAQHSHLLTPCHPETNGSAKPSQVLTRL